MREETQIEFIPTKIISQQVPCNIDLGFCCVNEKIIYNFKLVNYKTKEISYSFDETFFEIQPQNGILKPKQQQHIQIICNFTEANVIVAKTILRVADEEPQVIKISAIGKYPFLKLSTDKVEISNILVGDVHYEEVQIKNISEVGCYFEIEKIKEDDFDDRSISISNNQGYIPQNKCFVVRVKYQPKISDFVSYQRYQLQCIGGNKVKFEIFGSSKGITARFDIQKMIFPQIKLKSNLIQSFYIYNDLKQPITFQFMKTGSIFKLSKKQGIINPENYVRIYVKFEPQKPLNYFQRIFCFFKNQDLKFIDFYGSCRNLFHRPEPIDFYIQQNQEDNFIMTNSQFKQTKKNKNKPEISGFDQFQKENRVNNSIHSKQEKLDFNLKQDISQIDVIDLSKSLIKIPQIKKSNEQYQYLFYEQIKKKQYFEFSQEFINFGSVQVDNDINNETITIKNNHEDITLYFNFFIQNKNFQISKQFVIIEPQAKEILTLHFQPKNKSKFYYSSVHIVITSQTPQNSEQNSQQFIDINNKLYLDDFKIFLTGNTFGVYAQPFIPMVNIEPPKIIQFPPCKIYDRVYQALTIKNETDTPCFFQVKAPRKPYRVYPKFGLIKYNSFANIIVEFNPEEEIHIHEKLTIKFNLSHTKTFILQGYCMKSKLDLGNQGELYFPPCYLGVQSQFQYQIRNRGRMPAEVQILVPEIFKEEIKFKPDQLILKGNETKDITALFVPYKKMHYKFKCPVLLDGLQSKYNIKVFGEGKDGQLSLTPNEIDFGIIMVNFINTSKFLLHNNSDTTFYVSVKLQILDEFMSEELQSKYLKFFLIDFQEGLLPSKSQRSISITFNPRDICDLKINLCIIVKTNLKNSNQDSYQQVKAIGTIRAKANYPLLKVTNIKNNTFSVASLWDKFQISGINKEFNKKLSDYEKMHMLNKKLLFDEIRDCSAKERKFKWNFGYLQINSKVKQQRIVYLTFQNVGGTDLEWNFQIAEQSEYSNNNEEQQSHGFIDFEKQELEKKNFSFKPKKGKLKPQQKQIIKVAYHPYYNEDNEMNLEKNQNESEHKMEGIIDIQNGKSLKISFLGRTLSSYQGKLVLKSQNIKLPTLPINLETPVKLFIGFQNIGSNNIKYQIKKSKFIQENNINPAQGIIDFNNNEATLLSNEKKYLEILFKPLEVKKYTYKTTLKVFDFYKEIQAIDLTFEGEGTNDLEKVENNIYFLKDDDIETEKNQLSENEKVAYLSEDQLDFRNILYGQKHKRTLFLYNNSNTTSLEFEFEEKSLNLLKQETEFTITPLSGKLLPKEKMMIQFTLEQTRIPMYIQAEINCKIKWLNNNQNESNQSIQSQQIDLQPQEENLFIRIKKSSDIKYYTEKFLSQSEFMRFNFLDNNKINSQGILEHFFENLYSDLLTEKNLKQTQQNMENRSIDFVKNYDNENLLDGVKLNGYFKDKCTDQFKDVYDEIFMAESNHEELQHKQNIFDFKMDIFNNLMEDQIDRNLEIVLQQHELINQKSQKKLKNFDIDMKGTQAQQNRDQNELIRIFKKIKTRTEKNGIFYRFTTFQTSSILALSFLGFYITDSYALDIKVFQKELNCKQKFRNIK